MDERALDEIRRYSDYCRALVRDIDDILHDRRSIREGWKIHYAVDFSEIHAYLLPMESHETAPIADGWVGDPLLQYITLSRLLGEHRVIVPEPYVLELSAFTRRMVTDMVTVSLSSIADTLAAWESALESGEAASIKDLAHASRTRPLTEGEVDAVISFFERHAIPLVAFTQGSDWPVRQRLERLLKRRSFIGLEEVIGPCSLPVDSAAVRRHFDELMTRRGKEDPGSSVIDAQAIEEIRAANRALQTRKERILLVTRSLHVARVADAACAVDGIPRFVRHPRIFSAMYGELAPFDEGFDVSLTNRRNALLLFITAAKSATESGTLVQSMPQIGAMMTRIRSDWSSVEGLASTLVSEVESNSSVDRAKEMLRLISGQAAIADAIRERVGKILQDVERTHEWLGFHLQAREPETDSAFAGRVLYEIEFDSPELRGRIGALAGRWNIGWPDAMELIRDLTARAPDHDVMLCIAVGLGVLGKWDAAAQYAALAIRECASTRRPAHEALFLRSVCLHRSVDLRDARALSVLRDALRILDEAETERNVVSRPSGDPRYLYERALLWMSLGRFQPPAPPEEVGAVLRQAWELAPPGRLRDRILNALVAHHLDAGEDGEVQRWLDTLRDIPNPPAFIVDTAIAAAFRLDGQRSNVAVLRNWVDTLRTAATSPDVTPNERTALLAHAEEIQTAIRHRGERKFTTS